MSLKDVKQTTRSQLLRLLLISCCLLLLLGVVYWYSASTEPLSTAVTTTPKATDVPETGGQVVPQVAIVTDSAQGLRLTKSVAEQLLPEVARKVVRRRNFKAAYKEMVVDMPVIRPVDSPPVVNIAPPVAETEKKVVASVSTEPTEIKPFAQPVPVGVSPADVKPVIVQPTPMTVNAAPVIKRKTKNDEDVEIDLN